MGIDKQAALADINGVLSDGAAPGLAGGAGQEMVCSLYAECIRRLTAPSSHYRDAVARQYSNNLMRFNALLGSVHALLSDVKADRTRTFEELVHASLFADFLAGAQHLLEESWPLPAAVVAGSTLEEHLRKMAVKHGLPTEVTKGTRTTPKQASTLNDELFAQEHAYSKADHAIVLGWIHIRNEAAHGKPEFQKRTHDEIDQMIQGIRGFVAKYPA
jgi:hypothetical protein